MQVNQKQKQHRLEQLVVQQNNENTTKLSQHQQKIVKQIVQKQSRNQRQNNIRILDKICNLQQLLASKELDNLVALQDNCQVNSLIYFKPKQINQNQKNKMAKITKPNTNNSNQNPKPLNKDQQNDGKWFNYLKFAYDHYCKSTYRSGKNATFDRIKSSSALMYPSTFVAFCRDFQIKLDLIQLMTIFKKSTNFQSCMKFEDFYSAIFAITQIIFGKDSVPQNQDQNQFMLLKVSNQTSKASQPRKQNQKLDTNSLPFKNMLKQLQMHSAAAFNNKMRQIDQQSRKHGLNPYENLIKLKPLSQYKFKVAALNGKNPEDVKQQIQIRKSIKRQRKAHVHTKKIQKQKADIKFAQINKLSVSQKKVAQGGYMSPMIIQSNNYQKLNIINEIKIASSKVTNEKTIMYSNRRGPGQLTTSNKSNINANNRIHTQFNTYQNSLDSSSYIQQNSQRYHSPHLIKQKNKKQVSQNLSQQSHKGNSYLKSFRERSKNDEKYKLNSVIRQAKIQSNQNKKQSPKKQSIFASQSVYDQIRKAIKQSRSSNNTKIMKQKYQNKQKGQKLNTMPISLNDSYNLKNIVKDDEEQDQYLSQLIKSSKNKKRVVTQL